jgi:GMP synthase (glutamine-hydrolysing)
MTASGKEPAGRTATAIRHVPFEDLGSLAPLLSQCSYDIRYVEAGLDDLGALDTPDLLVVLGGPIGAYEEDAYPFLRQEIALVEKRLAANLPTLGVCLGAQIMARALGARVYPSGSKEIGWSPLALTAAGSESCLAPLGDEVPVLHWHGDTFDLPAGATHLAATEVCDNQAFAHGSNALGLQFHIETTRQGLEQWFIGHACEIAVTADVTVASLRADTARFAAGLEAQSAACFTQWLDGLAVTV